LLSRSVVTDHGLKHVQGLTGLKERELNGTPVTANRVAALQKALPKWKKISGPTKK
jgi:hypothetical protein